MIELLVEYLTIFLRQFIHFYILVFLCKKIYCYKILYERKTNSLSRYCLYHVEMVVWCILCIPLFVSILHQLFIIVDMSLKIALFVWLLPLITVWAVIFGQHEAETLWRPHSSMAWLDNAAASDLETVLDIVYEASHGVVYALHTLVSY